ncbi:MAG: hypothetical protein V4636_07340 [Pseudomonadota bacterium]
MMIRPRLLAACSAVLLATGCAQFAAPPYAADYTALDALKRTAPDKVNVAEVQPTDPAHPVNNLSLRGARLRSATGTFAQYLESALRSDLKEIAVYDPAARTRINATIQRNEIDVAGVSTGEGFMDVELIVTRDGIERLRKVYQARTSFESSFAGAVAVPKGQSEYPNLVRTLLKQVYTDPAFIAAIGQPRP